MTHNLKHALCKVRTITVFINLTRAQQTWQDEIANASAFCHVVAEHLESQGYAVQSVRMVTNPFGEYLDTKSVESASAGLQCIQALLNQTHRADRRIRFAIGEAKTIDELALLPGLINDFGDMSNACVNIQQNRSGLLDSAMIEAAANTVLDISKLTQHGESNFNFTVNFNCRPLIPYFPASYHHYSSERRYVIGLETPNLLLDALQTCHVRNPKARRTEAYQQYYQVMRDALQSHITHITNLLADTRIPTDFTFAGVDSSAAPSKHCASITDIYQQLGLTHFGAAGTVEVSSLLTKVFKSIHGVELTGFSGLMLALMEDTGLAQGSRLDHFDIRALLTYSAVCGIGLDTVPIPGDTSVAGIAGLMRDTGTMAFRLNKPLTVRLFPIPGRKAGEQTQFDSDDLCNCKIMHVP